MSDARIKAVDPQVLARMEGPVGRLSLNRPEALHALNLPMCSAMTAALMAWRKDERVRAVVIDHAEGRGFCAGGDIRMIAESGAGDGSEARRFFHTEYRLNHLLFGYPKPVVAFMDGIVMGGGVGISDPADIRIVTERTVYAMPETGIGLFPDVGGGWFLPRMPGHTGIWVALTGARLKAADCLPLEIGTHFVESDRIDALKAALAAEPDDPKAIVERFASDPGSSPLEPCRDAIDRLFAHNSIEAIFEALKDDGSDWALAQLETLKTKSPQSLKVSLAQMRRGERMATFAEVMAMEYRLGGRVVRTHDFQEGVRSVIVDKDGQPRWSPARIEDVSDAEVEALFTPLPADEEWTPLPTV